MNDIDSILNIIDNMVDNANADLFRNRDIRIYTHEDLDEYYRGRLEALTQLETFVRARRKRGEFND